MEVFVPFINEFAQMLVSCIQKIFFFSFSNAFFKFALLFLQTLKLNHKALSQTTNGKIVNLSSTDAIRLDLVRLKDVFFVFRQFLLTM